MPARFKMALTSADAAFDEAPAAETVRLLRLVADQIEAGERLEGTCRDVNGNYCGEWELYASTDEEDEHCPDCGLHRENGHLPDCPHADEEG